MAGCILSFPFVSDGSLHQLLEINFKFLVFMFDIGIFSYCVVHSKREVGFPS